MLLSNMNSPQFYDDEEEGGVLHSSSSASCHHVRGKCLSFLRQSPGRVRERERERARERVRAKRGGNTACCSGLTADLGLVMLGLLFPAYCRRGERIISHTLVSKFPRIIIRYALGATLSQSRNWVNPAHFTKLPPKQSVGPCTCTKKVFIIHVMRRESQEILVAFVILQEGRGLILSH